MSDTTEPGPVDPLETKKAHDSYRLTKYSLPWGIFLPFVWYELKMIREGHMGGPLSHVAWWAYGDRYTLRWWLCASLFTAFMAWVVWHFAYITPAVRELLILLSVGAVVGVTGWLVTR